MIDLLNGKLRLWVCLLLMSQVAIPNVYSQKAPKGKKAIPAVHSNIGFSGGKYYVESAGKKYEEIVNSSGLSLDAFAVAARGTRKGIDFDFQLPGLTGTLFYGFIPYGDSKHPLPVYFKRSSEIVEGRASINIAEQLSGVYDMVGWQKSGKGTLGYRVVNSEGNFLYDGKVSFKGTGPFEIDVTIIEGPFVNLLTDEGATISFVTNEESKAIIKVDGKSFSDETETKKHEIKLSGLEAATQYDYTVEAGGNEQHFSLKTAPEAGSRSAFTFSYASDSRNGNGGGERNLFGANFYIMKRIMALNRFKDVAFMQFSGDLIDGYLNTVEETDLQYANWKRAVEPFWHYFPIYISMGNHEVLMRTFADRRQTFLIDRFPYATESAEAVFAANFVNPQNGPESEDGASYDPVADQMDFPSYKENVFYYTYDNVAVVVMNSDYFYAPSTNAIPVTSGGMHGYIMDKQLEWLGETIEELENDAAVDHIFITQHTPFFPNGGHVRDDMWYNGNNTFRPFVAGRPLKKGIIERRDELLDIIVNKSQKVIAILTGDEHNYARTEVGPETNIYPADYQLNKVTLSRTIWQINNGAAGAPYYAQEQTPWTPKVSGFTTQNALVFFHINGESIEMEVRNPDTLEEVDTLKLR